MLRLQYRAHGLMSDDTDDFFLSKNHRVQLLVSFGMVFVQRTTFATPAGKADAMWCNELTINNLVHWQAYHVSVRPSCPISERPFLEHRLDAIKLSWVALKPTQQLVKTDLNHAICALWPSIRENALQSLNELSTAHRIVMCCLIELNKIGALKNKSSYKVSVSLLSSEKFWMQFNRNFRLLPCNQFSMKSIQGI